MFRTLAIAALFLLPGVASAQDQQAESGKPPQRIRNVTLSGAETCPKPVDGEVVVCSTLEEPYRIPKALRESKKSAATNSWVNRAATMDEIGREAGGLPDTCSPVGSGGQTGCALRLNQQYAAERAEKKRQESSIP
jgi:hypothetical protein